MRDPDAGSRTLANVYLLSYLLIHHVHIQDGLPVVAPVHRLAPELDKLGIRERAGG